MPQPQKQQKQQQEDEMNEDLRREREKATFEGHEFSVWWAGGEEKYEERQALGKLISRRAFFLHCGSFFIVSVNFSISISSNLLCF